MLLELVVLVVVVTLVKMVLVVVVEGEVVVRKRSLISCCDYCLFINYL